MRAGPTIDMHVAVLGAGYAGLAAVRQLEASLGDDVEITLVDERETHLVQHLVHRAVREPSLSDRLTIPLSDLLTRATHRQARVTGIDPDRGEVQLANGSLSCDAAVVSLGARTAFYGLPGVEAHATPLKRLEHAARIREEFTGVPVDGRAVVCGAGLSGIQVAGELAALGRDREEPPEVVLLEQQDSVAPGFPEPFQRAVAEELADRDVTVRTGMTVTAAEADAVAFDDGERLAYDQLIWTGGITGGDSLAGDRPQVPATLRLGDRAFGAGDAVRVVDAHGQLAPASAQTAVRQAGVAATNVERLVAHHRVDDDGFEPRLDRYRYDGLGWVVSVGDGTVAQVGGSVLRGSAARAVKTTVAAGYLGQLGAVESAAAYVREQFHH
jgi:NADH dehydrogenase